MKVEEGTYHTALHEIFAKHLGHSEYTGLETEVALFIDKIMEERDKRLEYLNEREKELIRREMMEKLNLGF